MTTRTEEHIAWNLAHDLEENDILHLSCPRCCAKHEETLTSDPAEPDYFHHVHQCTQCGLRFDLFVRCRGAQHFDAPGADTSLVSKNQIVAYQVRAMRSIVENMRASLASYVDAVKQSPELRARLVNDPASELGGAFDLVIRRASAIVDSAAKTGDGPTPETKGPPS